MEMKLTSIDLSDQAAEGCRSSWLLTLASQLIDCSPTPGVLTANYDLLGNAIMSMLEVAWWLCIDNTSCCLWFLCSVHLQDMFHTPSYVFLVFEL